MMPNFQLLVLALAFVTIVITDSSLSVREVMPIGLATHFRIDQINQALIHFRSLILSNADYEEASGGCLFRMSACVSGIKEAADFERVRNKFSRLGVSVHALHNVSRKFVGEPDGAWENLVCASQIADDYFLRGHLDTTIFFIGVNFVSVGGISIPFLSHMTPGLSLYIHCAPKLGIPLFLTSFAAIWN